MTLAAASDEAWWMVGLIPPPLTSWFPSSGPFDALLPCLPHSFAEHATPESQPTLQEGCIHEQSLHLPPSANEANAPLNFRQIHRQIKINVVSA